MTVYQYFQDQAELDTQRAAVACSARFRDFYLADAEKWKNRARKLTQEEAGKLLGEVILWRIIEAVDGRNLPTPSETPRD